MTFTGPDHQGWMTGSRWAIRWVFGGRRNGRSARQRFTYARVSYEGAGQPCGGEGKPLRLTAP
ncbi:hypothetical protein Kisp02_33790 [Kineosporia sp. NBRC 101731]|nr:hypothetical protein Kisp02_33790 [Kineosporia sp. NBRC 101731]